MKPPFQPTRAHQAMQMAAAAYMSDMSLVKQCFPSAESIEYISDRGTDTQVLCVAWKDVSYCAFRGTQFSENWSTVDVLRNTKFRKVLWGFPGTGVRAHRGYAAAVDSVAGKLKDWLFVQRSMNRQAVCTGHSMGGVEASGAALLLEFDATYTFGAPRFGNKAFAKQIETRNVFRVVHESDIAPSYPHKWLGYRHAGQRWQLSREGGYSRIDGDTKDFYHYPYLQGKADHKPIQYLEASKKGHFV